MGIVGSNNHRVLAAAAVDTEARQQVYQLSENTYIIASAALLGSCFFRVGCPPHSCEVSSQVLRAVRLRSSHGERVSCVCVQLQHSSRRTLSDRPVTGGERTTLQNQNTIQEYSYKFTFSTKG